MAKRSLLLLSTLLAFLGIAGTVSGVAAQESNSGRTQAATQATGQIEGTVVAAKGAGPLKGATVSAYRLNPAPTVSGQTTIDKNGSFTIGSLSPGTYGVCAMDTANALLNGCEWRLSETTVNVTNGGTAGPVTITLQPFSTLTVQLNDGAGFLAALSNESYPPHVLAGVWDSSGRFHPAIETTSGGSGRTLQVRVPFDTPLRLHVQSQSVALMTSGNAAVPLSGYDQTFLHSSSSPGQQLSFSFTATGRN